MKDFFSKCDQFTAIFTGEILNGKLYFYAVYEMG